MNTDAESRAALQERLAVFTKVIFWAFVAVRTGEVVLYRVYPQVTPNHYGAIVAIGVAGLGCIALAWGWLARRELSLRTLRGLDIALMAILGTAMGASAILASNRSESAYAVLIYSCMMVFMRTIVVPSTGRRTAVVAAITFAPLIVAAAYLALETTQAIPREAFFAGGVMYNVMAAAIASAGSQIIYGLRRRVARDLELGQYRLHRKLGEGALGEVFVAQHALLRRPTAVKLVRRDRVGPHELARCERAVQQMSQLLHHNNAAVFDYGRSPDGVFYYAMEYLDGFDLEKLVDQHGPQSAHRIIPILAQLCDALNEAHQRGFTHGNIKPSNVILCERGGMVDVAKLTDYGFGSGEASIAGDLQALGTIATFLLGGRDLPAALARFTDACGEAGVSARTLAAELRAIPCAEWDRAKAREWWLTRRRQSAPFLDVPTTIAVDLAKRAIGDATRAP